MRNSSVAHVIRNQLVARQGGTAMQVEREIIFPASPTEVWEALTEPERLEEWLAAEVPVARQAVAKQLTALADAGLLRATRAGRETRYEVTPEPLQEAVAWMVDVGSRWDDRLAKLGASLARAKGAR